MNERTPTADEAQARPKSVAELARHLGVHRSQISRAITSARRDPATPNPPTGQRDDLGREFFDLDEFLAWWPTRRPVGRPRTTPPPVPGTRETR